MRFLYLNTLMPVLIVLIISNLSIHMAHAQDLADNVAPEFSSGITQKQLVKAKKQMVVAANPYASEVGFKILQKGGNAIDAMVAVQTVLGLVEPQSSGLGGGAFLVYFDARWNAWYR